MAISHFLSLMDLSKAQLLTLLDRAQALKTELKTTKSSDIATPLKGKTMAMLFEQSSTRTRTSFEIGMAQLGGNAMFLSTADSQINRGEPLKDTARVLSRMVDIIVMRTTAHARLKTMAQYATVPVVNALCDTYHPCQILADLQTYIEHRGAISKANITWVGDGNNVCHSWMNAARLLGFNLTIATPKGFEPNADLSDAVRKQCGDAVRLSNDPMQACQQADCVITDTWASMGQEQEKSTRARAFKDFCVDEAMMQQAKPDALFMHCLPAYRGSEVTEAVLEGPQSVIWDEAENRLHAQKALLELLLQP